MSARTNPPEAEDTSQHDTPKEGDAQAGAPDPLFGSGIRYTMGWARHEGDRTAGFGRMMRRLPELVGICLKLSWRADRNALIIVTVCQLLVGAATAGGLLATNSVLQQLLTAGPTPDRIAAALPALALVGVSGIAIAVMTAWSNAMSGRLKPKVEHLAYTELLARSARVELLHFQRADFHDLLDAAQYGAGWIDLVIEQLIKTVTAVMGIIAAAGVLGVLHPLLLPLLPLIVVPRGWAAVRATRMRNESRLTWLSHMRQQASLTSLLTSKDPAEEIRAHAAGDFLLGHYDRLATHSAVEQARLARADAKADLVAGALSGLTTAATYVLLGWLLATGRMALAAAGTAVLAIRTGTNQLGSVVSSLAYMHEYGLYTADWRDACRQAQELAIPAGGTVTPATGPERIEVRDLRFSYVNAGKPALNGVNLTIGRGEVVALVGHNGSGKTTLAKLLTGLYLPEEGSVTWDGVDTAHLDRDRAFDSVALLSQGFERWPFTVRSNVAIGRYETDPTAEALTRAAASAGAVDLIEGLKDGWDTLLAPEFQGGVNLSGGQWQRIALTRAYFRDAPLLVLDEPTAALDPRAEAATFAGVRALAGGRTVVLITHRLHSVQHADRILVLQDGVITENGTHQELLELAGEYAELWALQAGQYNADTPTP
ncbi:ABC transporter ATP-binding protein [Nonomuraea sp. NPDC049129]|uniref:ABC transporter ATP-binding protein n=1 Tax=Nonomuraea sp. NPDC049129 TaxID=3155272 RepID=UPI00340D20DA